MCAMLRRYRFFSVHSKEIVDEFQNRCAHLESRLFGVPWHWLAKHGFQKDRCCRAVDG